MDANRMLQIVKSEPNLQERLRLLVHHGFLDEASTLIRSMVYTHTALFHYDWHDREFSRPLPRVTDEASGVYVILTTSSKLDYHPFQRKEGDQHVVFELGFERKVLGWTEEECREFVRLILAQALARPLNQWSLKQAEGSARASRQLLPENDPMAREVAAQHLVFHLREADFGHICMYLAEIKGFPFVGGGLSQSLDEEGLVKWIVSELHSLAWTNDRIRKELAEWMWLKVGTWAQWFLAVAKANVFTKDDLVRAAAVRKWLKQGFGSLLMSVPRCHNEKEMVRAYRQLFQIGQFGSADIAWINDRLVEQMVLGKVSSVRWFIEKFASVIEIYPLWGLIRRSINAAVSNGNYGMAVLLSQYGNLYVDPAWLEIVEVRGLEAKLS